MKPKHKKIKEVMSPGSFINSTQNKTVAELVAEHAYAFADAFLAEREKNQE